jgi:hypothetical protein
MKTANSKTIDTRVTKKKDNKETRSVIKSSKDSLIGFCKCQVNPDI